MNHRLGRYDLKSEIHTGSLRFNHAKLLLNLQNILATLGGTYHYPVALAFVTECDNESGKLTGYWYAAVRSAKSRVPVHKNWDLLKPGTSLTFRRFWHELTPQRKKKGNKRTAEMEPRWTADQVLRDWVIPFAMPRTHARIAESIGEELERLGNCRIRVHEEVMFTDAYMHELARLCRENGMYNDI
jgi:hypothetical protein